MAGAGVSGSWVVVQRNPLSGSGRGVRELFRLVWALRRRGFRVRLFSDRVRLDAWMRAASGIREVRCIVAAGGDGTVADLVNRHPGVALAVLPLGTENLLAKFMGFRRSGEDLAEVISGGRVCRLDSAVCNGRRVLLMVSCGPDANVVAEVHRRRSGHISRLSYVVPVLRALLWGRLRLFEVTAAEQPTLRSGSHVIISNVPRYGFDLPFCPDAATTAMYGVVVLLTIREIRSFPAHATDSRQAALAGETPVSAADAAASATITTPEVTPLIPAKPRSAIAALRHLLHDHNFLLFMTCSLLTNIVFMQSFVTLPLYLYRLGFNELEFGRMICLNGALIVLLQLPATHLLSRFPRGKVLICGELLMAAGFSLTAFATTAPAILLTITLWTLGEILQAPWKPTLVSEMAPLDLRARYMGLFSITHALSIALGAPIGGLCSVTFRSHRAVALRGSGAGTHQPALRTAVPSTGSANCRPLNTDFTEPSAAAPVDPAESASAAAPAQHPHPPAALL
ncbi:hypothetical protein E3A20_01640 [Planctomyces bekefii]|uniref:DAGKc domain-containing protein n=1 Tax=Planctomyces bekefii TaxID=1653850 RepID=A0A5C6ME53_9PLAN|nr:hypothetical protein E3A20_01640 [Planctomyces bekefii]